MNLPPAFKNGTSEINVIIETPKGSRNKFDYDCKTGLFKLGKILPAGAVFPYHFGFIPHTKGGDGDALDIIVMMELPAFPVNLIACRLLGIIEALQIEKDKKVTRNDRLIAIPIESRDHD